MIDRERLVRRHLIRHTRPDAIAPLTVGNGELAFTADVTGLQSFPGFHEPASARAEGREAMPLATQAQWGFHEMPNPNGYGLDDVMRAYASPHGDVEYPVLYDFLKGPEDLSEDEQAGYWLWVNPHRLDLARLGLELRETPGGEPVADIGAVTDVDQVLDPWTGVLESRFSFGGERFRVTTVCHAERDAIGVRVESAALADGRATLALRFPYASDTFGGTADWDSPERHRTEQRSTAEGSRFVRTLDASGYVVDVRSTGDEPVEFGAHDYRIGSGGAAELEVVLEFTRADGAEAVPDFDEVRTASEAGWRAYWTSGAAIDFAQSTDPRAIELERRVVLSQYQTRVNCAGTTPSAETGLVQNSWAGKFHLEMYWWHAAHFAMWGRPELLERSFAWYLEALPVAREIAARQGYAGARWPKHVGPEGRESPNDIGPLLIWQQPHPIHLAELIRLARAEDEREIVERYGEVVEASAEFIVSFLAQQSDGRFHLAPPIMPAQERYDPATVWNPPFELAYFHWGLATAQRWRELRGLGRSVEWDSVLEQFAPLPVGESGWYEAVGNPPRTEIGDHPSMVGALGVVPRTPLVDDAVMLKTLEHVLADWDWNTAWGWDFPMLAMTAARLREPVLAVHCLLMDSPRNRWLANGHNCQDPRKLPLYLPGNGGLLAAVALMAAGWEEGGERPGFPDDGTWTIEYEGFSARP